MNIAYNMDCLSAMREMPDNAFDLAVVDPPYGDALTDICGGGKPWNRFGERFDRYKYPVDKWGGKNRQPAKEYAKSRERAYKEQAEHGHRSSQKNYIVGCSTEAGVF